MAKIKLCGVGMEAFNGYMGSVLFENGVSVEDAAPAQIRLLGALTTIMILDGDKEYQGGMAANMAANIKTGFDTKPTWLTPEETAALDAEKKVEAFENPEGMKAAVEGDEFKDLMNLDPVERDVKLYSREELEAIADEKGIRGLREIGDKINVRGNAIVTMIEAILKAQKAHS